MGAQIHCRSESQPPRSRLNASPHPAKANWTARKPKFRIDGLTIGRIAPPDQLLPLNVTSIEAVQLGRILGIRLMRVNNNTLRAGCRFSVSCFPLDLCELQVRSSTVMTMIRIRAVLLASVRGSFAAQTKSGAFAILQAAVCFAIFAVTDVHAEVSPKGKVSVLVYHDIQDGEAGSATPSAVRLSMFKQQMRYLSDNGYRTLGLNELEDYVSGKKEMTGKVVALHFDDGLKSVSEVLPVLSEYRFKASFAIVAGMVGVYPAMNWAEIKTISANPRYDILSHTMTHNCSYFKAYDGTPGKTSEKAEFELAQSRRLISEKIGKPVNALVWPCVAANRGLTELAARVGYTSLFRTDGQSNSAGSKDRFNIRRIGISGYCNMNEFARTVSTGVGIACAPSKSR